MRREALLVAAGVSVLLALVVVGAALATPPSGQTSTSLTRATLGEFKAKNDDIEVESQQRSADVAVVKVVLQPGGSTGWHHHPGVGLASVASGAVTFYDEECNTTVYEAGEGFLESHEPMLVRNEGNVVAEFYVTFIVPTETTVLRNDVPEQPSGCTAT